MEYFFQTFFFILLKMSASQYVGTLAYLVEEQALVVRVDAGWQYVAVSNPLTVNFYVTKVVLERTCVSQIVIFLVARLSASNEHAISADNHDYAGAQSTAGNTGQCRTKGEHTFLFNCPTRKQGNMKYCVRPTTA